MSVDGQGPLVVVTGVCKSISVDDGPVVTGEERVTMRKKRPETLVVVCGEGPPGD